MIIKFVKAGFQNLKKSCFSTVFMNSVFGTNVLGIKFAKQIFISFTAGTVNSVDIESFVEGFGN